MTRRGGPAVAFDTAKVNRQAALVARLDPDRAARRDVHPGSDDGRRGESCGSRLVCQRYGTGKDAARVTALVISQIEGQPVFGGTLVAFAVVEAFQAIKAHGWRVILALVVMMDLTS